MATDDALQAAGADTPARRWLARIAATLEARPAAAVGEALLLADWLPTLAAGTAPADLCRAARQCLGWSYADVASRTGLGPARVARYESGRVLGHWADWLELACALGIPEPVMLACWLATCCPATARLAAALLVCQALAIADTPEESDATAHP